MYLQLPTEEQKENARREFNATKETVKNDVKLIMEWIDKQPHLPTIKDEDLLAHCLINCKQSVQKAKSRIEAYFNTKAVMPEVFRNRDPFSKEIERVCTVGMYVPLPKLTPDGYRVIILYISDEARNMEPSPFSHFLKATFMTIDILGKFDYPKGVIIVNDGKNITKRFVTTAASELHKLIILTMKTIPVRYRNIYFCNMTPAAEIFLSIGKSLMKKKLAKRVKVLNNPTDLCEVLPPEIVPGDYGGYELPLRTLKDRWFEEIRSFKDFLIDGENFISDLSKKPTISSNSDTFGINGCFKTLNID